MSAVTVLNIILQEANPIRRYVLTTMKGDVEKSMRLLTTHLMMGCKSQEVTQNSGIPIPDSVSLVYRVF